MRKYNSLVYIFLTLLALLWTIPFIILVLTALRTQNDIVSRGVFAIPKQITFDAFITAWKQGKFNIYFKNSLMICFTKVPIGILIASLAAYPLSVYNFRLRDTIFLFFLSGIGISVSITLFPLTLLLKKMLLLNSLGALFFPYIAFGLPFQILVCRGFFHSIPKELIDAARIDGASESKVFRKVILPLSKPAIASLFIIDFLGTWNEFIMALIFINSDKWKTVPIGLTYFQDQFSSAYPTVMAGVLISILPVVTIYVYLQKYFVKGLAGIFK